MNDKILCKPWLLGCRPASARGKLTQLAPYCTAPGVSPNSIGDDHMRGMLEAFLAESDQNKPEHGAVWGDPICSDFASEIRRNRILAGCDHIQTGSGTWTRFS